MCRSKGVTSSLAAALLMFATVSAPAEESPVVKAIHPIKKSMEVVVDLPGTLRPWEDVYLFARVAGYAREVRVDRGSRVKAGDTLIVLDAPELPADAEAAHARMREAAAELGQKRAEAALAKVGYERMKQVRKEAPEGVTLQTLQEAQGKADVAARAVDLAEARTKSAEAAVKRAETMADLSVIRAPFGGLVTERFVDPGAFVPAAGSTRSEGARLVHLANLSRLRLEVSVPETENRRVNVGTQARITLDARPGSKLEATVSRRAGMLTPGSRTEPVELDVENPEGKVPAGAFARVSLIVEVHKDATVVPRESIVSVSKKPHLAFIEDGKLARKPVKLGPSAGVVVEVLGVEEGEALRPVDPGAWLGVNVSDSMANGTAVTLETSSDGKAAR